MDDLAYTDLFRLAGTGRALDKDSLEVLNSRDVGLSAHLGIRYLEVADGRVRAELPVGPHLLQPAGLVNGGALCALAESVGSLAGLVTAGAPVVGVNNDTDFIAGVREGVIEAKATPVQAGGRTQLWEILMRNEGRLVARSTLRTMVMNR
ncbi:PaaI family thioesterase [Corynebacterium sp.]|uniref:PaaI family thioesterase n=1 Tax=Corynebacterium sp. TaxID=1720 RepID=UPI0026DF850A|nr:PaaI family thioesterase [Corynebacterium sp.]MDO5511178.1 PaaI family thioesterase [Corynebacterium sp.]